MECAKPFRVSDRIGFVRDARDAYVTTASCGVVTLVHVTTVPGTLGFLRGQLSYLATRGFAVWVVSSPGSSLEAFAKAEGVRARGVEMTRQISPLADLVALARLWRFFREVRPAVVHGHTPKAGLFAMLAAFLAGVPVRIYTLHGLPLETATGWKKLLLRATERVSCLLSHRVQSVSASLNRKALAERLCRPGKLRLLENGTINGVDATHRFAPGPAAAQAAREIRRRFGIPLEALVIGFVGRIVRDKGIGDLVRAWNLLRDEFEGVHLLMTGTLEPQDPIPPDADRVLRSDPRIHLAGHMKSMPGVYAAMDVVVLPTYREGFPQVALEAAAMERPIVASRVTGCVDAVVDGTTGVLVPPGAPAALAGALRLYLRDADTRQRHGRAARIRALRSFRPEALWRAMEREYRHQLRLRLTPEGADSRAREVSLHPPSHPRSLPRAFKRILDVAGAIIGLVAALPILCVIALGIWVTLGRPILFRQVRAGWKGRPFTLLKFRTMRPGSERSNQRVTKLGRFLRRTSLDELPQFWNVLQGDMSLVGPRPLLMEYVGRYTRRQARRLDMWPGMTGWCQVNGRNSLTWNQKFELDEWYVENWSLGFDFRILLRTLARVVGGGGVEGPGNACWTDEPDCEREHHEMKTVDSQVDLHERISFGQQAASDP